MRRIARILTLAAGSLIAAAAPLTSVGESPAREERPRASRITANPLITVANAPVVGDNINGPSVIRVPNWVARPLGRYYLYFAHHMGHIIRLAYADAVGGPWRIHEPGVLHVRDTAFYRPQPDPPEGLDDFYTHVASPEVRILDAQKKVALWYHGWWTNGERWPDGIHPTTQSPRRGGPGGAAAIRAWVRGRGYGQFTELAESTDGVTFTPRPDTVTRASYLRVFGWDGRDYMMARLGRLGRAEGNGARFEPGPNPFRDGPYADRVRHVAVLARGSTLWVFFSAIGDAPERILASRIEMTGDWSRWRAGPAIEVLRPEAPYECARLPIEPSLAGDVKGPVRQLRDPAVFEDAGRTWLFYSVCGEQGLAAAELRFEQ